MFYVFKCEGTIIVVPMSGSAFERDDNGDRVTELEGDAEYDVDPNTLEILIAEQVAAHILDVSGPPTYDAAFTESATEFFAGVVGMTVIAAANEKYPNSLKARMAYILATLP